jgi:hypothetical protein
MFDYYQPQPEVACPFCGKELTDWQGKDGPCALFVWRQGVASPVDHPVSDDVRAEPAELARARLPTSFLIYAYCCGPHYPVEAICRAPNGVWSGLELITAKNATQRKEETRAAFKARLKWLSSAAV